MANCLIKNSEYRTKLALSGIPEFIFYTFANLFVQEHGRFPHLDEIPGSNSSLYLQDTIHMKKNNSAKIDDILTSTKTSNIEDANRALNDLYLDLEINLMPLNTEAIVDILQRPSEYEVKDAIEYTIDENPNTNVVLNNIFDKLYKLYGINIIPITNKELASSKWKNIPDVKNVSAFIYQGNTYINTDLADIDAPIHEMTHLLLGSIRFKNPELYLDLISIADQFKSFNTVVLNNSNRTLLDIYEEAFVLETARYLAGLTSDLDSLDNNVKYELHYNIKRLLDSALFGRYSVKSIDESQLYNMSLKLLATTIQSMLLNSVPMGSMDDATLHRVLANKKSDLMSKGDLREDCL